MSDILFNPLDVYYKSTVGAVKRNEKINIRIDIIKSYKIFDLQLVYIPDMTDNRTYIPLNVEKKGNYNSYFAEFSIPKKGIYWYCFMMRDCFGMHYIDSSESLEPTLTDIHKCSYQLSVYNEFKGKLDWLKGKIIYQILVDRFCDGGISYKKDYAIMHEKWNETPNYLPVKGKILNNDFFGGDLLGVIEKLDYLKSLNVGVIYLNPIFLAYSNHKYDTADYLKIDPMFGDEKIFKRLCDEAKKRDINIILDGVFNHTGSDSIYFNKNNTFPNVGAYQSKESKYYHWYKFIEYPDKYHSWWGFDTLPAMNQDCKEYRDFIANEVVIKWLDLGAKGFRLDVVDELNTKFLCQIAASLKKQNKENVLIGEVWEDASNKIAYGSRRSYFDGLELDSAMNYPFRTGIIDYINTGNTTILRNILRQVINNYPKHILDSLMNMLGTHDTVRILNALDESYPQSKDKQAKYRIADLNKVIKKLKMATILQFTLPGIPSIYYGDEVGLEGFKDPFCRRTMPWDDFNNEILAIYEKLGNIRNDKAFKDGVFKELYSKNGVFFFQRGEDCFTIVNNCKYDYYLRFNGKDLIEDKEIFDAIKIMPFEAKILKGKVL